MSDVEEPFVQRVTAAMAYLGRHVDVTADLIEVHDVTLDDLAGLVEALTGAGEVLADLDLPAVTLSHLRISRDVDGEPYVELAVDLAGLEWRPTPELTLRLDSLRALHAGTTSVVVEGSGTIDGLELAVSVQLPAMIVSAVLGTPTPAGRFLDARRFLPPATGRRAGRSPHLLGVSIDTAPLTGHAIVHVAVADLIDADPFRLTSMEVELSYAAGLDGAVSGQVWCSAEITTSAGPVLIDLGADADPAGWHVTGSARLPPTATLGALVEALVGTGTVGLPAEVAECALVALDVGFGSADSDVSLHCALDWPHDGAELSVTVVRSAGAYAATGTLIVGDLTFTVAFGHHPVHGDTMVAAVRAADGHPLDLAAVLTALGADGVPAVPLHARMRGALVGLRGDGRRVLTADIDAGLDLGALSTLPVLGSLLPAADTIRVGLRPVGSTGMHPWPGPDVDAVRALAPPGAPALPDRLETPLQLTVELHLGAGTPPTSVPLALGPTSTAPAAGAPGPPSPTATPPAKVTWIDVGRRLGPLHVQRVGFAADTDRQHVDLLVTAAVEVGGLTLSVDGLALSVTLPTGEVGVALRGFGIDYAEGPVEIGGAFLNLDGDFAGSVVVRTEAFALHATGAVAMVHGTPSVYLYGVLDYPLGGPPFFFVDGLAAGFAVHRSLALPTLAGVRTFPLVADAIAGPAAADRAPAAQLARLHEFVAPEAGAHFLAVGVKFTSFKLVECFALLVVRFGTHVEIDLLGTATYQNPPVLPPGLPALARIEMDLRGRFAPDEGVVSVEARLTERSYVYSELCHLFGGFAFATWFAGDLAGDFVLSVGGYHPDFVPPPHYPAVDRVGMRYQITPDISLTGTAYLALTPAVFMAGGELDGVVGIGDVRAWFTAAAHFLIGWQPYHYDLRISLAIGASWGPFHTSAHAELHLWGPEFSGAALVEWTVFSFRVHFGDGAPTALPITWAEFTEAFLPPPERVCSVHVAAGLVRTVADGGAERHVVGPAAFAVTVSTVVPATAVTVSGATVAALPDLDAVGLGPTALGAVGSSTLDVAVERRRPDGTWAPAGGELVATPEAKGFPPAVWSPVSGPVMDAGLVRGVGAVTLRPARPVRRTGAITPTRADVDYAVHEPDAPADLAGSGRWGPVTDAAPGRRVEVLRALGILDGRVGLPEAAELRADPGSMTWTAP